MNRHDRGTGNHPAPIFLLSLIFALSGCAIPGLFPPSGTDKSVAAPDFSEMSGTYSKDQSVTISDSTPGATIYYTTDGSTPSTASPVYSARISVAGNGEHRTIKAFASKSGFSDSRVRLATYSIEYSVTAIPKLSPSGGAYSTNQSVTIATTTRGATIHYTTDGTVPTAESSVYSSPITVTGNGTSMTIKAIATATDMSPSEVGKASYSIVYPVAWAAHAVSSSPTLLPWTAVASSSDGKKLVATVKNGDIWTSSDSGASWKDRSAAGARSWTSVASSADGTHLAATDNANGSGGDVWTSADSGATWRDRFVAAGGNWTGIASSADGTHLAAVVFNGGIWKSSDYGASWSEANVFGGWWCIASSSDGKHLVAAFNGGDIWTSKDFGATWTVRSAAGNRLWQSVASSSNGSHLAAVAYNGGVWISTDTGETWADESSAGTGTWTSVASSADGSILVAAFAGGDLWKSTDGGAAWTDQSDAGPNNWTAVASSSDGLKQTAVLNGSNSVYTGP